MLYLFDCDGTLWDSEDHDYIGSVVSDIIREDDHTMRRIGDGKVFKLLPGVRETWNTLKARGDSIGIVSDNPPEMVQKALQCLELYPYITTEAFNVRLWKGYCPKHTMVEEILANPKFSQISRSDVILIDDKDYAEEAKSIGIQFRSRLGLGIFTDPRRGGDCSI